MAKDPQLVSFSNFNPIALFALILLLLTLILSAVGTGLTQWARFETEREFPDDLRTGLNKGRTYKTQGLVTRCIEYEYGQDLLDLGRPSSELPQDECISMTSVDCSRAQRPLLSAHDLFNHSEIHNTDSSSRCDEVKVRLQAATAFMILGILATFVAMILFFPFFYWIVLIAGCIIAFLSVILLAIGIGLFGDTDQDFAGFFSVEGAPSDGCLSYGFGIALAALFVDLAATIVGIISLFFYKMKPRQMRKPFKQS